VIEFHRARAETKMTIAAERLAVIAGRHVVDHRLSSVYGTNIMVMARLGQAARPAVPRQRAPVNSAKNFSQMSRTTGIE
jgi:hypothetical protein